MAPLPFSCEEFGRRDFGAPEVEHVGRGRHGEVETGGGARSCRSPPTWSATTLLPRALLVGGAPERAPHGSPPGWARKI
jgi:hypothetical protein